MKSRVFQIYVQAIFLKLIWYLIYKINMWLAIIVGIDQNIIQIHHNKNTKLFSKNYLDIAFKIGGYIRKTKKHDLIFKMTIFGVKNRLLLVIFSDFYLKIYTSQVQLCELLDLTQLIQGFINQRQWISSLDHEIVKILIIDTQVKATIWLPIKKDRDTSRRLNKSNKISFKVSFVVYLYYLQFYQAKGIYRTV